jgi:hypothetical protein
VVKPDQAMGPVETSAVVFFFIFIGAMLGMWLSSVLPEEHLNPRTKEVVTVGMGLIGTMTALVLGLLVASAKSSYDERSSELTQMAANAILLDRVLAHYGPETRQARGMLKLAVSRMVDQTWPKGGGEAKPRDPQSVNGEPVFDMIQELEPHTDGQGAIKSEAQSLAINLGQTRWLLFAQGGSSISRTFLVVVVFWLSILFVSFGLFAPRNATVVVTLLVSALSVAGAIFLVLELEHPFSGLIQISSAPLQNALAVLAR